MSFLHNMPIKRKVSVVFLLLTNTAPGFRCGVWFRGDSHPAGHHPRPGHPGPDRRRQHTAALMSNDQKAASESLASLRVNPHILCSCISVPPGSSLRMMVRRPKGTSFLRGLSRKVFVSMDRISCCFSRFFLTTSTSDCCTCASILKPCRWKSSSPASSFWAPSFWHPPSWPCCSRPGCNTSFLSPSSNWRVPPGKSRNKRITLCARRDRAAMRSEHSPPPSTVCSTGSRKTITRAGGQPESRGGSRKQQRKEQELSESRQRFEVAVMGSSVG